MKVSTIIATIALVTPAVQAQFCNRNTPLVCCLSVKSHGCVCLIRTVCLKHSAYRIHRSARMCLKTYVPWPAKTSNILLTC